ncbi:hypothetical protein ACYOEI_04310 [Singulisphaera rosea]
MSRVECIKLRRRTYLASVEGLEGRSLMAAGVSATLTNKNLSIVGTEYSDQILLYQQDDRILLNGKVVGTLPGKTLESTLFDKTVQSITVDGRGGNDAIAVLGINVSALKGGVRVKGGAGADAIATSTGVALDKDKLDLSISISTQSLEAVRGGLLPGLVIDLSAIQSWDKKVSDAKATHDRTVATWNKWQRDQLAPWNAFLSDQTKTRDVAVGSLEKKRNGDVTRLTAKMDSAKATAERNLAKYGLSLSDIGFGLFHVKTKSFTEYANDASKAGKDIAQAVGDGVTYVTQAAQGAVDKASKVAKAAVKQIKVDLGKSLSSVKVQIDSIVKRAKGEIDLAKSVYALAKRIFDFATADLQRTAKKAIDQTDADLNVITTKANAARQELRQQVNTSNYMADRLILGGLEKIVTWGNERWQGVKTWGPQAWKDLINYDPLHWVQWSSGASARIDKITVLPKGGNNYEVDAVLTKADGNLKGIRWTVEHNGKTPKSEYKGTGDELLGPTRFYSVAFAAPEDRVYTITLELKDNNDHWYKSISRAISLPVASPVVIFEDSSVNDDGRGGASGGGSSTSYVISSAEQKRGFALPYVLASAGVYDDQNGDVYLGVDMVEVTDETEASVTFERRDAQDRPLNQDGYSREELTAWKAVLQQYLTAKGTSYGWGETSIKEEYEFYEKEGADVGSLDDYLMNWALRFDDYYQATHAGAAGPHPTIANVLYAEHLLSSPDGFRAQTIAAAPLKGDAITKGVALPAEVKSATNGQNWAASITVKEAARSKPEVIKLDPRLNADFVKQVRTELKDVQKGLDTFRQWSTVYVAQQAEKKAAETLRKVRNYEAIRGVGEAARMNQKDAEALFGTYPGIGFFLNAGNAYMYAKEGSTGAAVVDGAFALLDILASGLGQAALEKVGKLVPFGSSGKNVVQVVSDVARDEKALAGGFAKGMSGLKTEAAELKAAGMSPVHAKGLQKYSYTNEGTMVVARASNPKSLQYQGKIGYLPKPEALKLKTDKITGLVMGRRLSDGTLIDAVGNKTNYLVNGNGKIINNIIGDKNFGKETAFSLLFGSDGNGYVVDAAKNKFFGDYDLMGVYHHTPGTANQWIIDTTESIIANINSAMDSALKMVQHGTNDAFWKELAGEVKLGNPDVGTTFIVALNGKVDVVDLVGLKQIYESKGILWPLGK